MKRSEIEAVLALDWGILFRAYVYHSECKALKFATVCTKKGEIIWHFECNAIVTRLINRHAACVIAELERWGLSS